MKQEPKYYYCLECGRIRFKGTTTDVECTYCGGELEPLVVKKR